MYGDSEVVRRRADQLREQGVDVKALAAGLVGQAEVASWGGRAGEAMLRRVRDRATGLRGAADEHFDAADSLVAHAAELERLTDLIEQRERQVRAAVLDAERRVAGVRAAAAGDDPAVDRRADPADEALVAFELPPRGHRAWLTLELPGPPGR